MSAIIPGILEQDWDEIKKKIEIARLFTDTIHIDLLDGSFAENRSFLDPEPFRAYTHDMTFELHLMVDNPLQYLKPFADAGFQRFLGHIEMMPNQIEFIGDTQLVGDAGLVLDSQTPSSDITVSVEDLDSLLVMTVKAGFSGQQFLESSLHKVSSLAKKHPLLMLEVDGGITRDTLVRAYEAGARRFVATSAIFRTEDPAASFAELSEIFARLEEKSVLRAASENK